MSANTDFFEEVETFPNSTARERYDSLVGLDDLKARLASEAELLLDPGRLEKWSKEHHGGVLAAATEFRKRIPLYIFCGDVGTGKTALAQSLGDPIARAAGIEILLFQLSLRARGSGSVGEMTQLISSAFDQVRKEIPVPKLGKAATAGILLIDEADAVAQSRELYQMHHEDRAGVNALIRGLDSVSAESRPVLTIMCTNRVSSIDPAVQRRAAQIVSFERPDENQRRDVLDRALAGVELVDAQFEKLVKATGPANGRPYGYTYSDLVTRFVPAAIIDAYPDRPIDFDTLLELTERVSPTAPFSEQT
jgi:AAA+ superfamily predicted ATPase